MCEGMSIMLTFVIIVCWRINLTLCLQKLTKDDAYDNYDYDDSVQW